MNKFSNLDLKRNSDGHTKLQKKVGGRPKKNEVEKANYVLYLNVNEKEREILENESKNLGISIVSLVKISLSISFKNDFFNKMDNSFIIPKTKIVKQIAIRIPFDLKEKIDKKAQEFGISISELIKFSLKLNGFLADKNVDNIL